MIEVYINGTLYSNVADLSPIIETDFFYSVKTLDGVLHRKFKGKKTNYEIVFFNKTDGSFYELMNLFEKGNKVLLGVPTNATDFKENFYFPTINDYDAKGILNNGEFYHNALLVEFNKESFDE